MEGPPPTVPPVKIADTLIAIYSIINFNLY